MKPGSALVRSLVGLLALAAAALPACATERLLSVLENGSFEAGGAGAPIGWTVEARPGTSGRLDSSAAQHGRHSLRLDTTAAGAVSATSAPFPVSEEDAYLVSLHYRAEGMSAGAGYEGVSCTAEILWSRGGTPLQSEAIALPYRAMPWRLLLRSLVAPPGASSARVRVKLTAKAGGPPTRVWLDDVRFRRWDTRPGGTAPEATWYATEHAKGFRPVADDDSPRGRSVVAHSAHQAPGTLLLVRADALPAGAYRADFLLKGASGESDQLAAQLEVLGSSAANSVLAARPVKMRQLEGDSRYTTFSVPFVQTGGPISFRVQWPGRAPLWLDSITVTPERLIDERGFADVLAR